MRDLLRAAALCAIAGGALRIADSFTANSLPAGTLAMLYLVTDMLLLAGIAGVWWRRRASLGRMGAAGVAIFVAGILAIRIAAFGMFGANGYQFGATLALLGLAAYSIEALFRRGAAPFAPLLWLVSLGCGIAGAAGLAPGALTVAAGVCFGAGFVAAGAESLTRA